MNSPKETKRILNPGDPLKVEMELKYRQFQCPSCGCLFEASKKVYVSQAGNRGGIEYHSECPECGGRCIERSMEK